MNEPHSLKQSMRESKRYKTRMKEKTKIWFTYPYGEYYEDDGTKVLFNREYQLIWKITPSGDAHRVDEITYCSDEVADTTTFFTEKSGAGWNTPKYRTYVKNLMDELEIDPEKLDAIKLYTQREGGKKGNSMIQESDEDDIDLLFPENSKDFWRWVAGKRVTEGPRGDFIQDTRDLLDCEFMTLERITSKRWSACDEARKQGNDLEREYKKEMAPESQHSNIDILYLYEHYKDSDEFEDELDEDKTKLIRWIAQQVGVTTKTVQSVLKDHKERIRERFESPSSV